MVPFSEADTPIRAVSVPWTGVPITAMGHADQAAVQCQDAALVSVSLDGEHWGVIAHAQPGEVVPLPLCQAVMLEPSDVRAVILLRYRLR